MTVKFVNEINIIIVIIFFIVVAERRLQKL